MSSPISKGAVITVCLYKWHSHAAPANNVTLTTNYTTGPVFTRSIYTHISIINIRNVQQIDPFISKELINIFGRHSTCSCSQSHVAALKKWKR